MVSVYNVWLYPEPNPVYNLFFRYWGSLARQLGQLLEQSTLEAPFEQASFCPLVRSTSFLWCCRAPSIF